MQDFLKVLIKLWRKILQNESHCCSVVCQKYMKIRTK